jgi:hypothetical protein
MQKSSRKLPVSQKAGYLSNVKKGMTITLLMIFFLYNTGSYIMYMVSARQLKQEVRTYISNHPGVADVVFTFDLDNGKVTDKSFYWEDDGAEFSYKGSLYDVVSSRQEGGKLFVKCIGDKKEKELKLSMAKMNRNNKSKTNFSFSPFSDKVEPFLIKSPTACQVLYNLTRNENIKHLKLPLFIPPPDLG